MILKALQTNQALQLSIFANIDSNMLNQICALDGIFFSNPPLFL